MNCNRDNETGSAKTYFAPAERANETELRQDIARLSKNPVIDTVMHVVAGLVAVLNEHRQILAINDTLLKALGVNDADEVLGLRPGEAINCIHAHEQPGGCGTSKYCSTCGAAIAIVSSLANDKPELRECVATVERDGEYMDLHFQVRCCPITFKDQRFLLLFLQDTTIQQQQAALERAFFHDFNNTLGALVLNSQMLDLQDDGRRSHVLAKRIRQLAEQLGKELEIQRVLSHGTTHTYQLVPRKATVTEVIQEIQEIFANHPVSIARMLRCPKPMPNIYLVTDVSLLRRILINMLTNAFEATEPGGTVRLWVEPGDDTVTFYVWNGQAIPDDVALRVFQRNFSTKAESGRGLGTYTMKLFSETYLGGKVDFTTSEEHGTTFRLCVPKVLGTHPHQR
jgi:hypothetical protein